MTSLRTITISYDCPMVGQCQVMLKIIKGAASFGSNSKKKGRGTKNSTSTFLFGVSRKRVERIRFGSADFPLYFADFFLNIRIFLKKIGSSMKKSATSKLLRTIRQINFRLILSDFDEVKC